MRHTCECSIAAPCEKHRKFYDGFKSLPPRNPLQIGDRVYITGNHPHAGESGVVESVERTLAGPGLKIRLENCPHGTDACFVFKPTEIRRERRA